MYTVQELLLRKNKQWISIDFTLLPPNDPSLLLTVYSLLREYDLALVLVQQQDSLISQQYALDEFLGIQRVATSLTLVDYFGQMTSPIAITPRTRLSITNTRSVKYKEAFTHGFSIMGALFDPNAPANVQYGNFTPDLEISPAHTSPFTIDQLTNKVLYLINDRIFFETVSNGKAYLPKACDYLNRDFSEHSKQLVGIIDFSEIGGFERHDLQVGNITRLTSARQTEAFIKVTLPVSGAGKTPLLVIGGKLWPLEIDYIWANTARTEINIRLNYGYMVDAVARTLVTEGDWISWADTGNTGFTISGFDPIKFLTQGNSAVLLLDTDMLSVTTTPLGPTGFPALYQMPSEPTGIVYLENGNMSGYTTEQQANGVAVRTNYPTHQNPLIETVPESLQATGTIGSVAFRDSPLDAHVIDYYTL